MKTATINIIGTSPLAQGRKVNDPALEKEGKDDYDARTWRSKMHVNDNGKVIIPSFALKNCLAEAAKFLSIKIPNKGKSTYTKHFEAGVMVPEPLITDINASDVLPTVLFVPTDGVRGSGKRCNKHFPVLPSWGGTAQFMIFDETITKEAFLTHIDQAGKFIGLGSFRPRNNGYFGRFNVELISWE